MKTRVWRIVGMLLSLWLMSMAETSAGRLVVRVENGLLWLRAERATVQDVLAAVARQSGATVTGAEGLFQTISIELSGVPVDVGVRRLLKNESFVLEYTGESLTRVDVIRAGRARPNISDESVASAGDDEWVRQLTELLETSSSPSGVLLLEQVRHHPNATNLLIQFLDALPSMGEKGQAILHRALESQNAAIRGRAAELLRKTGVDLQP